MDASTNVIETVYYLLSAAAAFLGIAVAVVLIHQRLSRKNDGDRHRGFKCALDSYDCPPPRNVRHVGMPRGVNRQTSCQHHRPGHRQ